MHALVAVASSGPAILPINRWTNFDFNVNLGNDPSTVTMGAGGTVVQVIFSIAHAAWLFIAAMMDFVTSQKLMNSLLWPTDWVLAEVAKSTAVWVVMLIALMAAFVVALYRLAKGDVSRALRTVVASLIPFFIAGAMMGGALADHAKAPNAVKGAVPTTSNVAVSPLANPSVMSPGWIADWVTKLQGDLAMAVPHYASLATLGASAGEEPSCQSYVSALDDRALATGASQTQVVVSDLFDETFVQPFEIAQFGSETSSDPNGNQTVVAERIGCRYLDYTSTQPSTNAGADQSVQVLADRGTGMPTTVPSPNLFSDFGTTTEMEADVTFWATCMYSGGKWTAPPGMGAKPNVISGFNPSADCARAWSQGLYSKPGQQGGNGKDFEWATSIQTMGNQESSALLAPVALSYAQNFDGAGWGNAYIIGLGTLVGSGAALVLFLLIAAGLFGGLLGLTLILTGGPIFLIWAMLPFGHHSKVWLHFGRTLVGVTIGVVAFTVGSGLVATVTSVLALAIQTALSPFPLLATLFVAVSPVAITILIAKTLKRIGLGSIARPDTVLSRSYDRIKDVTRSFGNREESFVDDMRSGGWRRAFPTDPYDSPSARRAAAGRTPSNVADQDLARMQRLTDDGTSGPDPSAPSGGKDTGAAASSGHGANPLSILRSMHNEAKLPHSLEQLRSFLGEANADEHELALLAAGHWGKDALKKSADGTHAVRDDLSSEHYQVLAKTLLNGNLRRQVADAGANVLAGRESRSSAGQLADSLRDGLRKDVPVGSMSELRYRVGSDLARQSGLVHGALGTLGRAGINDDDVAARLRHAALSYAKEKAALGPPSTAARDAFAGAKTYRQMMAAALTDRRPPEVVGQALKKAGLEFGDKAALDAGLDSVLALSGPEGWAALAALGAGKLAVKEVRKRRAHAEQVFPAPPKDASQLGAYATHLESQARGLGLGDQRIAEIAARAGYGSIRDRAERFQSEAQHRSVAVGLERALAARGIAADGAGAEFSRLSSVGAVAARALDLGLDASTVGSVLGGAGIDTTGMREFGATREGLTRYASGLREAWVNAGGEGMQERFAGARTLGQFTDVMRAGGMDEREIAEVLRERGLTAEHLRDAASPEQLAAMRSVLERSHDEQVIAAGLFGANSELRNDLQPEVADGIWRTYLRQSAAAAPAALESYGFGAPSSGEGASALGPDNAPVTPDDAPRPPRTLYDHLIAGTGRDTAETPTAALPPEASAPEVLEPAERPGAPEGTSIAPVTPMTPGAPLLLGDSDAVLGVAATPDGTPVAVAVTPDGTPVALTPDVSASPPGALVLDPTARGGLEVPSVPLATPDGAPLVAPVPGVAVPLVTSAVEARAEESGAVQATSAQVAAVEGAPLAVSAPAPTEAPDPGDGTISETTPLAGEVEAVAGARAAAGVVASVLAPESAPADAAATAPGAERGPVPADEPDDARPDDPAEIVAEPAEAEPRSARAVRASRPAVAPAPDEVAIDDEPEELASETTGGEDLAPTPERPVQRRSFAPSGEVIDDDQRGAAAWVAEVLAEARTEAVPPPPVTHITNLTQVTNVSHMTAPSAQESRRLLDEMHDQMDRVADLLTAGRVLAENRDAGADSGVLNGEALVAAALARAIVPAERAARATARGLGRASRYSRGGGLLSQLSGSASRYAERRRERRARR